MFSSGGNNTAVIPRSATNNGGSNRAYEQIGKDLTTASTYDYPLVTNVRHDGGGGGHQRAKTFGLLKSDSFEKRNYHHYYQNQQQQRRYDGCAKSNKTSAAWSSSNNEAAAANRSSRNYNIIDSRKYFNEYGGNVSSDFNGDGDNFATESARYVTDVKPPSAANFQSSENANLVVDDHDVGRGILLEYNNLPEEEQEIQYYHNHLDRNCEFEFNKGAAEYARQENKENKILLPPRFINSNNDTTAAVIVEVVEQHEEDQTTTEFAIMKKSITDRRRQLVAADGFVVNNQLLAASSSEEKDDDDDMERKLQKVFDDECHVTDNELIECADVAEKQNHHRGVAATVVLDGDETSSDVANTIRSIIIVFLLS